MSLFDRFMQPDPDEVSGSGVTITDAAATVAADEPGEKIPASACVPGEDYFVDCEDGHPPCRMKYEGLTSGKTTTYRFRDKIGAKAELNPTDKVWRVKQAAAPTPAKKYPCGAAGCGVGCQPGYVTSGTGFVYCTVCGGKGSETPPKESAGESAAPPKKRGKKAAAPQPDAQAASAPAVPDPAPAVPDPAPAVPDLQTLTAASPPIDVTDVQGLAVAAMEVAAGLSPAPTTASSVSLTADEVEVVAGLFRERASLIPRRALSDEAVNLLRRLRLVN